MEGNIYEKEEDIYNIFTQFIYNQFRYAKRIGSRNHLNRGLQTTKQKIDFYQNLQNLERK